MAKLEKREDGSRKRPRDTFTWTPEVLDWLRSYCEEHHRSKGDVAAAGVLAFAMLPDSTRDWLLVMGADGEHVLRLLAGKGTQEEKTLVDGFRALARRDS